ncbi:MAG: glycoside hydrolase family 30 protein [Verrucomicrobiota bacterium]
MSKLQPIRNFITAKEGTNRLTEKKALEPGRKIDADQPLVFVAPDKKFQTIEGMGGAFTEAAATTLKKLSPANQKIVLEAYFDSVKGHGYSLCRTHIQSCDFALGNYAYVAEGDLELKTFSIDHDKQALLPMIKEAHHYGNEPFKLFASPWSPPGWMKTTGIMNKGGKLKPECREAWAQCYVKYIRAYEKEGVQIWGITVQNEPAATQPWDSCEYSAEEERDFVRDHLGPALEKAGLGYVKIMIWDHNRDILIPRAYPIYADPAASKYIWGTAYHWYGEDKFDTLNLHHDSWPDKPLLFTEGCQEGGPHTGEWGIGERYAHSMINDFNRWSVGWTDWNLLLDERGGPNHVGNFCSAPILADTQKDEVLFQSSYYYIGHFARFVRPGAKRILCSTNKEDLEATAFINPDGKTTVVVLNRTELQRLFCLNFAGIETTGMLPAHSIGTYILETT